jgi:LPXTG-motif cell wall-anchored protein
MRKNLLLITGVLSVALLLAPMASAQSPSPQEVVQAYYAALGEASTSGGFTALLDLFADNATVTMAALSPQPISGKTMLQTMFTGMAAMLKGVAITADGIATEGGQVTVTYRMTVPVVGGDIHATDTFVVQDGKIQSLNIQIAPEDLGKLAGIAPAAPLPTTGAEKGAWPPAILGLGGVVLIALGVLIRRPAARAF